MTLTVVGRKSRRLFAGAFRHLPAVVAFGGRRDEAAFPPYVWFASADKVVADVAIQFVLQPAGLPRYRFWKSA
jgi:hypothetical protein